ncbi:MAG: DUF1571 domain-containing protein [Planctomycetes bacterium]|nr:DUF1571 domain-containing protein [Planctomycetota bacterium]
MTLRLSTPGPSVRPARQRRLLADLANGGVVFAGLLLGGVLCSCSTADRAPVTTVAETSPLLQPQAAADLKPTPVALPSTLFSPPSVAAIDRQANLQRCLAQLQQAERQLAAHPTATATYRKRERLAGQLEEQNVMFMKVRREPMAVYMRWQEPDEGREAIWQQNVNDGLILVHPGGWKRKFVPLVKVDPHGPRAAEGSKRPINTSGPWAFNRRLLDFVNDQLQSGSGSKVTLNENVSMAGVACDRYSFEHAEPIAGQDFHRAEIYIDRQRALPVALEVYGFAKGAGSPPLDEACAFENLQLGAPLGDEDFSVSNPRYEYVK